MSLEAATSHPPSNSRGDTSKHVWPYVENTAENHIGSLGSLGWAPALGDPVGPWTELRVVFPVGDAQLEWAPSAMGSSLPGQRGLSWEAGPHGKPQPCQMVKWRRTAFPEGRQGPGPAREARTMPAGLSPLRPPSTHLGQMELAGRQEAS